MQNLSICKFYSGQESCLTRIVTKVELGMEDALADARGRKEREYLKALSRMWMIVRGIDELEWGGV